MLTAFPCKNYNHDCRYYRIFLFNLNRQNEKEINASYGHDILNPLNKYIFTTKKIIYNSLHVNELYVNLYIFIRRYLLLMWVEKKLKVANYI